MQAVADANCFLLQPYALASFRRAPKNASHEMLKAAFGHLRRIAKAFPKSFVKFCERVRRRSVRVSCVDLTIMRLNMIPVLILSQVDGGGWSRVS